MISTTDDMKGKALAELLKAAKNEKKPAQETGDEIASYGHASVFDKTISALGVDAELWFRTTVCLTAQAIDLMCPYLYPANPYRQGRVRFPAAGNPQLEQIRKARLELESEYLNLTPDKTDHFGESVRAINQSQIYGAGIMWTGFNDQLGLVHSVYGDYDDLFLDPDAKSQKQLKFGFRRRLKRRWEWEDAFPDKLQVIATMKASEKNGAKIDLGKGQEMLEGFECWMLPGIHHFTSEPLPQMDAMGNPAPLQDAPRKFTFTEEGKLLAEENWEAPLWMKGLWPWDMVSYIESDNSIWPVSPLKAALPFQKALNWLFIFYMTKIRFCSRSLFAIRDSPDVEITAEQQRQFEMFNDLPVIRVRDISGADKPLGDIFQQLNLDPGLENFRIAHEMIKREYQEHSGLYDVLHTGEGDTQSRSARETQFRDQTSKTRINFRLDRVISWQSRIAQKEAMMAKFIHTPEQIDVILGPGSGLAWGQIMSPQDAQMQQQAQQAQMQMDQQQAQQAQQMGMPPPPPAPPMQTAVSLDEWASNTEFDVEADTVRRKDINAKIDALKDLVNTVVPVQLQSMDMNEKALAYLTLADYQDAIGGAQDVIDAYRQQATQFQQQALMMAQMQAQQMAMGGPPPGAAPPPGAPPQKRPAGPPQRAA